MAEDQPQVSIATLRDDDSVVYEYRCFVEDVIEQINRTPVVFSIPSVYRGDAGGYPVAYAIDFGMMTETITLKGVCKDEETFPTAPTIQQLARIAREGWRYMTVSTSGGAIQVKGGVRFVVNHGLNQGTYTFQGAIQSFMARRSGGQLRWEWEMVMQVARWPLNNDIILPDLDLP